MRAVIPDLTEHERRQVVEWIGERPETVISIAALYSGAGHVSIEGSPAAPTGVLVESSSVPGEPQAFGDVESLLRLLADSDGWTCVEVDGTIAQEIEEAFASRWGPARSVVDVIHVLNEPVAGFDHRLVRRLTPTEALELPTVDPDLLSDRALSAAAAEHGWLFAGVDDGAVIGVGGSLAAGRIFADVDVHVAASRRREGVATACASKVCRALQHDGLVPVWGAGAENSASLAIARTLGFVETARLSYLIRGDGRVHPRRDSL